MSDPVTRLNAALEGRYAIECELGEGGMARKGACHLWYELEQGGPSGPVAAVDARRTPAPTTRRLIAPLGKRKPKGRHR